jgi:hypothetical protein
MNAIRGNIVYSESAIISANKKIAEAFSGTIISHTCLEAID